MSTNQYLFFLQPPRTTCLAGIPSIGAPYVQRFCSALYVICVLTAERYTRYGVLAKSVAALSRFVQIVIDSILLGESVPAISLTCIAYNSFDGREPSTEIDIVLSSFVTQKIVVLRFRPEVTKSSAWNTIWCLFVNWHFFVDNLRCCSTLCPALFCFINSSLSLFFETTRCHTGAFTATSTLESTRQG